MVHMENKKEAKESGDSEEAIIEIKKGKKRKVKRSKVILEDKFSSPMQMQENAQTEQKDQAPIKETQVGEMKNDLDEEMPQKSTDPAPQESGQENTQTEQKDQATIKETQVGEMKNDLDEEMPQKSTDTAAQEDGQENTQTEQKDQAPIKETQDGEMKNGINEEMPPKSPDPAAHEGSQENTQTEPQEQAPDKKETQVGEMKTGIDEEMPPKSADPAAQEDGQENTQTEQKDQAQDKNEPAAQQEVKTPQNDVNEMMQRLDTDTARSLIKEQIEHQDNTENLIPEEQDNNTKIIPENNADVPAEGQAQGKKDIVSQKDIEALSSDADSIMKRLSIDSARSLIQEQLTPEKQAAYDVFEEKLVTDIEKRVKKLKEIQSQEVPEKPKTFTDKIKVLLTKEDVEKELYDPAIHGPLVSFDGIKGCTEIERYWVNEPYAFVVILFNPEKNSNVYYVVEPVLSDFEQLFLLEIKDRLKDVLLFEEIKDDDEKEKILTNKVKRLAKEYALDISPLTTEKILYFARRDFIKFGKIDPIMNDDRIEDVSANGFGVPIYLYHKKYTNIATNIIFKEEELDSYVIRLAQRCGKHISVAEPMIDATMPDGSRIQMTLGTSITTHGATFTIRKFSEVPITPVDLINWNTFSAEEMAYLWLCIENNKSLIYAGGTASGKTSSLNAVSLFIPWQAKIITLEDTRELKLPHPNWIPGVTRDSFTADGKGTIDMYDLLKAALRQRPEFLLVGEVRGKEALTLFQAMSTGHTTFSTMHADSVSSAIHRLENPPISVPRTMIQALNIISIQSQTFVKGKRARRNMKLVEITDIDPTTRNIRTNDIFVWDALTDKFNRVGESKALAEIMIRRGWSIMDLKKELVHRQKILEYMVNNKISDFNIIATMIHDYQVTPDKVLKKCNISG